MLGLPIISSGEFVKDKQSRYNLYNSLSSEVCERSPHKNTKDSVLC